MPSWLAKLPRTVLYPAIGTLLAPGSPLGLLWVRASERHTSVSVGFAARELEREPLAYAYLGFSTTLVFAVLGWLLGRRDDRLSALTATDPMTGLFNRRFLHEATERELGRSARYGTPLALLFFDVDRLKDINDRRGHHAGDRALLAVAGAIRGRIRAPDIAARWGGDEFAVLCPQTGGGEAKALAERVRQTVWQSGAGLAVAAGIAVTQGGEATAETLFRGADRALYAAKHRGRNRTALAPEPQDSR